MAHPLVQQLRFARTEWLRAFENVSEEDAQKRLLPINSLSWMMGHLAWHEHMNWCVRARGLNVAPQLHDIVGYGKPASTPPLADMRAAWQTVVAASDPWLDTLTSEMLTTHTESNGKRHRESIGTTLQRVIYHYFYHIGEGQAVRQLLGHSELPEYIGNFGEQFLYTPE